MRAKFARNLWNAFGHVLFFMAVNERAANVFRLRGALSFGLTSVQGQGGQNNQAPHCLIPV
jgi:hypothetical protein